MPDERTHTAVCIQQQQIGEIKAALQSRKEENQEIKGQLTSMVSMLTTYQLDQTKRDSSLTSELTKISTILDTERRKREEYEEQQNEQREGIHDLQKNILEINSNIKHLVEFNSTTKNVTESFDKRIRKLEKVAVGVYVAGVILGGIVIAIIYVTQAILGVQQVLESNNRPSSRDEYHQIQRVEDHSTTTTTLSNQRK